MTQKISFTNKKGGVGKTSLTLHTSGALAEMGKEVLVIDMDQQGNLVENMVGIGEIRRKHIIALLKLPESNERQVEIHLSEDELTPEMRKWQKSQQGYGVTLRKKPDAIFGLENQQGQTAWFILEVDRGTMTSKRFLQKMAAYYYFKSHNKFGEWSQQLNLHPQGKPINTFRIITYTVTPQWQDMLIKTTLRINSDQTGSKMFWFTNQNLVDTEKPETMFEQIFSIAQGDELDRLHSIIGY